MESWTAIIVPNVEGCSNPPPPVCGDLVQAAAYTDNNHYGRTISFHITCFTHSLWFCIILSISEYPAMVHSCTSQLFSSLFCFFLLCIYTVHTFLVLFSPLCIYIVHTFLYQVRVFVPTFLSHIHCPSYFCMCNNMPELVISQLLVLVEALTMATTISEALTMATSISLLPFSHTCSSCLFGSATQVPSSNPKWVRSYLLQLHYLFLHTMC